MWKIGCRSDKEYSVAVDQTTQFGNVDLVCWSGTFDKLKLNSEVAARLTKSRMGCLWNHPKTKLAEICDHDIR